MNRRIECIHFDLDSVLYIPSDFLDTTLLMSVKAMIKHGLKATPDQALQALMQIRYVDSNGKDHFDRLCFHFNRTNDPLIIAAGVEKYWDCKIGTMTSAPEANLILSALYYNYPLTIVSNGPPVKQAGKLVRLGLSHFFSKYDDDLKIVKNYFYADDERTKSKPYPGIWQQAQAAVGFRFSRAIMVGDRYWNDIFGANRLGMITVKVDQGQHIQETRQQALASSGCLEDTDAFFLKRHSREEILALMKPDFTIRHLRELITVVEQVERRLAMKSSA